MKATTCRNCGEIVKFGTQVCPECGQQLVKNKTARKVDKHAKQNQKGGKKHSKDSEDSFDLAMY